MALEVSTTSVGAISRANKHRKRKKLAILMAAIAAIAAGSVVTLPGLFNEPMYNSLFTGEMRIRELIAGNDTRFYNNFGMTKDVFFHLKYELQEYAQFADTRHTSMDEQLAIFLRIFRSGNVVRDIQDQCQRSPDTVHKVFHRLLGMVTSPAFYTKYVKLPADQTPAIIRNNPKWFPYFDGCLGAIDGTHIEAFVPNDAIARYRDRKGHISQNVLAACTFDLRFSYVLAGWEGSAADSRVFQDARLRDFVIPPGKFYLADAGFASCDALLTPYRQVRYHLREWGQGNLRPQNPKELFNLRHASARNVVERIFGIVKKKFHLLSAAAAYSVPTQTRMVLGVCALHNFIRVHDSGDEDAAEFEIDYDEEFTYPDSADFRAYLGTHQISRAENERAANRRDRIANNMWTNYMNYLNERLSM